MCACKGNSTKKQPTAVKQIIKKPSTVYSTSNPTRKVATKRVIFKRHM